MPGNEQAPEARHRGGVVGRALWAQCVSVGFAIAAGTVVYAAAVWILRVPEARQIRALVAGRIRGSG